MAFRPPPQTAPHRGEGIPSAYWAFSLPLLGRAGMGATEQFNLDTYCMKARHIVCTLILSVMLSGCGAPSGQTWQGYAEGEYVLVAAPGSG